MIIDDNLTALLLRLPDNLCAKLLLELKNNIQYVYYDIHTIGINDKNILYYIPKGKNPRPIETTPGRLLSKVFIPMWSEKSWFKGVDSINTLRALFYPAALEAKIKISHDADPTIVSGIGEAKYMLPSKTRHFIENFVNTLGINANMLGRQSEIFNEKMQVVMKYRSAKVLTWDQVLAYEKEFPATRAGNGIPECVFKVVQGQRLIDYYNNQSFWKSITSCMSSSNAQTFLTIYRENPEKIALGVILTKDRSPRVMSRCLLWLSDNGEILMDRRYMGDQHLSVYLDEICVENSFRYRNSNSGSRQLFFQGQIEERNFTITIKKGRATQFPYMDTFHLFTFFEEKKVPMIKLSMSPSTITAAEVRNTKNVRSTGGGYTDYYFNPSELLPWEMVELIVSNDTRVNASNPFFTYDLTFEQRDRICTARPDLINDAIMNWGRGTNRWLDFLSAYPKYRKAMDFTTLTSPQIKLVYDYCVNNRDFAWIKLCRVKNLTTKEFVQVLQNALQKMGPSEFIDRAGIKATNMITRMNNKTKKSIAKMCGERYPITETVNMDHITIMEYFIKPLREDNLAELLEMQPFWKKVIPEDHVPIPSKNKEENTEDGDEVPYDESILDDIVKKSKKVVAKKGYNVKQLFQDTN